MKSQSLCFQSQGVLLSPTTIALLPLTFAHFSIFGLGGFIVVSTTVACLFCVSCLEQFMDELKGA